LDFKIVDASAFYAGIPFGSLAEFVTTSLVYDEIKHIKKNHDALGVLFETGRLKIRDPESESTSFVKNKAQETGDFQQLSKEDISVLALCVELKGELISDDFAISNVAKNLGVKVSPIMTKGIDDVGRWVHYCVGCGKSFSKGSECPLCGNPLKRKLIKNNVS
jgi:UPF0271 protein